MLSISLVRLLCSAGRWGGALAAFGLLSGCATHNAELAIDAPAVQTNEEKYYVVHVGDKPTLHLRTKFISCDYANFHDELKDEYDDCGPALSSGFVWSYEFDRCTSRDRLAKLTVTGYQQAGLRDFMPVNGTLMESESTRDPPDSLVASASILVYVYQSAVDIAVSLPNGTPDWRLSRLFLTGEGGRKTRIRYRKTPTKGFFHAEGPDTSGKYRVYYEPSVSEISRSGPTWVELIVADETGATTTFTQKIETP